MVTYQLNAQNVIQLINELTIPQLMNVNVMQVFLISINKFVPRVTILAKRVRLLVLVIVLLALGKRTIE